MSHPRTIVGIGEALFDVYPQESRLGGAPLNFTVHAHQLGNEGVVVSRVGQDELGRRVVEELERRRMSTEYLQSDPDRPTGTVLVDLDERGEPSYDIVRHVAWDALQWDPQLETLARKAHAVCFGSLAQRDGQARSTIYRFVESAPQAIRLFDINIRQNYYDRRVLQRSLELASAAKVNTKELRLLDELLNLGATLDDAAKKLVQKFPLKFLAVTRGAEGTVLYTPTQRAEGRPTPVSGKIDAVGAGDAAAAAVVHGFVQRWPLERIVQLANTLGAYVASQPGACPPLTDELRAMLA